MLFKEVMNVPVSHLRPQMKHLSVLSLTSCEKNIFDRTKALGEIERQLWLDQISM